MWNNKRYMVKIFSFILSFLVVLSFSRSMCFADTSVSNKTLQMQNQSVDLGTKGVIPDGMLTYVYLFEKSSSGMYTTYDIYLYFGASELISSLRVPVFRLTNGSSLNPYTYYTHPGAITKYGIGATSGNVKVGSCVLPSSEHNIYVTTTNAQMYFYSTGSWIDIANLTNTYVYFN